MLVSGKMGALRSALIAALLMMLGATHARAAGQSTEFPFGAPLYIPESRTLRGGLVHVPEGVPRGARVPLVVFLHGLNQDGPLHKWLGGRGTPDLRPFFERLVSEGKTAPFLVAGPSQTRNAARPWGMWQSFDLGDFVARTELALGERASVDRSRVVLLAHSGGGCNVHGSILRSASSKAPVPYAVLAIDTCFDRGVAETLLLAAPETRIFTYFQRESWDRDFDAFRALFLGDRSRGPRDRRFVEIPLGRGGHDAIFTVAMSRALPELIPPAHR